MIAGAAIMLAGCAPSAYPAFDREPTAADAMPEDAAFFDSDAFDSYDVESLRYVGTYETTDLYIIRNTVGAACLFVAADKDSTIACGGGGAVTASSPAGTFELGPAPMPADDGWTVISENVRVLNE